MPYEMRCPKADYRDWENAPHSLGMSVADGQLVGTWNGRVPIRVAHQMANTETYERKRRDHETIFAVRSNIAFVVSGWNVDDVRIGTLARN